MVYYPERQLREGKTVNEVEFEQVADAFKAFHRRFAPLFGDGRTKARSEQYVRGLLVQRAERRNAENVAEAIDGAAPRALQRLLTDSPWDHTPLMAALQTYLGERLNSAEGVFILDETGFAKQGRHSVGVARQYCGTLGKVGNCQVGVLLVYASAKGQALVDMRLFLPEAWTSDRHRCEQAGVPADVTYQTKPQLGRAMLQAARQRGALVGDWVTADSLYGSSPELRDDLAADGWQYVLEVTSLQRLFTQPATAEVPTWSGRGRKPTKPRLVADAPTPQTVATIVAQLPETAWQSLTVAEGAQGPRTYQFAALRGWECRDELPGRATWLLARRNSDGSDLKYALSNAPPTTPLATLARVAATRWCIETEIQTEKGQIGLDEYEVRSWRGWHHHIALALLAGAFLVHLHQVWGEKDAPPHAPPSRPHPARGLAPPYLVPLGTAHLAPGHAAA
jgi:SRSO17 transposase